MLKRYTALRRSSKPIRRATPKRQRQLQEYSVRRLAFLAKFPLCQVHLMEHGIPLDKQGPLQATAQAGGTVRVNGEIVPASTQIHHVAKRYGDRLLDESKWLAVCWDWHERIERNKAWARRHGYLENY